jgi:NAD+ synthase (glutamine-hydrolysing)
MKIALAQMNVVPGRPDKNFSTMKAMIEKAKGEGADIVALPELCVGGYLLGDRWLDASWCQELMAYNEDLRGLSEGIVLLYGNVYLDPEHPNKDGRARKLNAVYAFQDGKPLRGNPLLPPGIQPKTLFPNYRIFDDERYFFSTQELALDLGVELRDLIRPFEATIDGKKVKLGLEVCEDLWFNDYRYRGHTLNVTKILMENGADCVFNLSASPWTYGKDRARDNRIRDAYAEIGKLVPFYYVNCVGTQNNGKNIVTFDGDSSVYDRQANLVAGASEAFKEELILFDDEAEPRALRKKHLKKIEAKYLAAVAGIRGLSDIMGSDRFPFIIGLSGGVDSSVVACLVERAVGPERIMGFNLPSRYNSDNTKSAAAQVARELGIKLRSISIESLVKENSQALAADNPSLFNLENIQAKIRGTSILSNLAAIYNGVMTNNGNKVEVALGYATLYGDVNGAIAPIGDLLKTEVFELARYLNEEVYGREVIPLSLLPDADFRFELPPSAELREAQVDPMKWGYHDALLDCVTEYKKTNPELILGWYGILEEKLGLKPGILRRYWLESPAAYIQDLEWFMGLFERAVFKRIQAPPIIIMSKGSFGYDIRESQLGVYYTRKYREIKAELLAKGALKA